MSEAPQQSRVVNVFQVPQSVSNEAGVRSLGLVVLTTNEEMMAFQRGKRDGAKVTLELAKAAVVEVDGKPISLADGSADSFWLRIHPKLRQLVMEAYASLHGAEQAEVESFLASKTSRVG